jgi:hypothetical protein
MKLVVRDIDSCVLSDSIVIPASHRFKALQNKANPLHLSITPIPPSNSRMSSHFLKHVRISTHWKGEREKKGVRGEKRGRGKQT